MATLKLKTKPVVVAAVVVRPSAPVQPAPPKAPKAPKPAPVKTPAQVKTLSLFSGIGGLDLAAERYGFEIVAQCEIDKFCQSVLRARFPSAEIYHDVRAVFADQLISRHGRFDAIIGGFPCQDISAAWNGSGLSGEKSGLWFEFQRLIAGLRPKHVVIENVANLRKRGLGAVLRGLAALGYDAAWQTLSAADVGAPHERSRLFIYAWRDWEPVVFADDCATEDDETFICTNCGADYAECDCLGPHSAEDAGYELAEEDWGCVAYPDVSGRKEQCGASAISPEHLAHECTDWWGIEPGLDRVGSGIPDRVDRLHALGNAVVPQQAMPLFAAIAAGARP